jgi:hypothetical protein
MKRGRPKGSRNRVYSPIAKEDKHTTRSSKAFTSLNTTSKQAYIAYVEDDPNESPYDFSFDPSYEDSNRDQDQDYVDDRVPNDKSEYHHAFYIEAESNPCDPTTLEKAKARSV